MIADSSDAITLLQVLLSLPRLSISSAKKRMNDGGDQAHE